MNRRTIGVDLAKDVFEIAVTCEQGRIRERHRFNRAQFTEFMARAEPSEVVMEACGTAHFWGRTLTALGHRCRLLPAQYVRPYRRRNKTDRADAEALIEANRCGGISAVAIKTVAQQEIQQLHRLREQWKATRVARINGLRGALRELGIDLPVGARRALKQAPMAIEQVPAHLRLALQSLLSEVAALEFRIAATEQALEALARELAPIRRLRQVEGIGLLNATALVAAAGSPEQFDSGRHFAAWLGLTPRESSSGNRRRLGRISKQGDGYLRMLIIHGARSVLARASQLQRLAPDQLSRLQRWALALQQRIGHNKATVALANKIARICWAVWRHDRPFDRQYQPVNP